MTDRYYDERDTVPAGPEEDTRPGRGMDEPSQAAQEIIRVLSPRLEAWFIRLEQRAGRLEEQREEAERLLAGMRVEIDRMLAISARQESDRAEASEALRLARENARRIDGIEARLGEAG